MWFGRYRAAENGCYATASLRGRADTFGNRRHGGWDAVTGISQAAGSTRAVERALALLAEVSAGDALTLSECARRTGLPASTALRLLRTLEAAGFAERGTDTLYRPGTRMIQLGALALSRQSLVRLAQPGMQRIVAATGESTYLVVAGAGRTAVYLSLVEGTHAVRHTSWVGRSFPLGDLAIGRALAGDVPAAGYLAGRDRGDADVTAIAAPIRWAGGVAGALNLLGPTYRIDDERLHAYGEIVAAEARAVADRLGTEPGGPDTDLRKVAT